MLNQPAEENDIRAIDKTFSDLLDGVRRAASHPDMTEERFRAVFPSLYWTVETTTGETVELIPGGAGQHVLFHRAEEYVKAAYAFRMNEVKSQVRRDPLCVCGHKGVTSNGIPSLLLCHCSSMHWPAACGKWYRSAP